jgi:hypothetical protein
LSERLQWTPVAIEQWVTSESGDPGEEPLGTKEKFWVMDPNGTQWLFKYARERDDRVRDEDWAECLVRMLAGLLEVPTAEVRLATCDAKRGVISRSVVPSGQRLEHGNELLAATWPGYDPTAKRENTNYTVEAVKAALNDVGAPLEYGALSDFTGFEVWAGYVMLDAWVGGRDRHHENWGAVFDGISRRLAPSFDHGNALGFQESDRRRAGLANDEAGLSKWARSGKSHHFAGRPSLVALASDALRECREPARNHWLDQLESLTPARMCATLDEVPASYLSDEWRSFCLKLLTINRERILRGNPGAA